MSPGRKRSPTDSLRLAALRGDNASTVGPRDRPTGGPDDRRTDRPTDRPTGGPTGGPDDATAGRAARETGRAGSTIAFALLIVLGLVLPFETPVVAVGPLTITTSELALYLLLAAWGVGIVVRGARTGSPRAAWSVWRDEIVFAARDPLGRAVAAWTAVIAVAALAAPAERAPALKFALRALSGGLLFFCARDVAGSAARLRAVAIAILIGAGASAAAAVAEPIFPASAMLWHAFRGATFTVTGLPRPSGPFAYPTIAAMYWEAALPLAVTLPFTTRAMREQGSAPRVAIALAAATVLILGVLVSATRTALAVEAISSVGLVLVVWSRGRHLRLAGQGTLAIVVVLSATTIFGAGKGSELAVRLRWWQDGSWYRARYHVVEKNLAMAAGTLAEVIVDVQNTGGLTWPHEGSDAVRLSYHWENTDVRGTHLQFEGLRSALAADVVPGDTARVVARVQAPDAPGRYRLRWDLLREGVTWFSERGTTTADQNVEIVAAQVQRTAPVHKTVVVESTLEGWMHADVVTRPALWKAAVRLWLRHPLLGVGPDNFRRLYPEAIAMDSNRPAASYDRRVHANSLYFETLADLGIVGIGALALLMVTLGRAGASRVAGVAAPLAVALVFAVGTFFVHGLLDWFLAFTPTYGLMYLLLALVSAGDRVPATRSA